MKLIKTNSKLRCELGVCNNPAEYALVMQRTGIRSRIYVCSECVAKLYEAAKQTLEEKKKAENAPKVRQKAARAKEEV